MWFNNEVVPLGQHNTRIIVLGNLLSETSFMMRLRKDIIDSDDPSQIFRAYPILDVLGKCLWDKKYPTVESLRKLCNKTNEDTWCTEYMLNTAGDKGFYAPDNLLYREKRRQVDDPEHEALYREIDKFDRRFEQAEFKENLAYLHQTYGNKKHEDLQRPLIEQMQVFAIRPPVTKSVFSKPAPEVLKGHIQQTTEYEEGLRDVYVKYIEQERLKLFARKDADYDAS